MRHAYRDIELRKKKTLLKVTSKKKKALCGVILDRERDRD